MVSIREMQQNVNKGDSRTGKNAAPQVSDDELREYVLTELDGGIIDKSTRVSRYMADLMARNPKNRKALKESLPAANRARKEKMAQLRMDAARTGMKKLKKDFTGQKKRAAKQELASIAKDKNRNYGRAEIDEKTALKDISTGRSRHIGNYLLQPAMNYFGLGSRKERRNTKPKWPDVGINEDISHKTPQGELKGELYVPNQGKSDKVVVFFSGSRGPSAEYAQNVVDSYLAAGASVVCLDYRGFGKSITIDKKGKPTGTPLSEDSIYKDGKEMLRYVTDKMKVKPENVILHGYSLGGAVASKVAADFAQEQQKKALEEGRTLKEQKLGGVVLHSPIDSMYSAAKNEVGGLHAAGFFGWAGAGGYNTKSHMRRLHKLDPDMPVHYVSGSKKAGDGLDIDATNIDKDPEAIFANSSSYRGNGDHDGANLNISDDGGLREIATKGRNAQLVEPVAEMDHEVEGPVPTA